MQNRPSDVAAELALGDFASVSSLFIAEVLQDCVLGDERGRGTSA